MRRTIGLKLTDKEERIISQLNKGGITNSELLRDALWFYFNSLTKSVESKDDKKADIDESDTIDLMIQDHVGHLKCEINRLHEQDNRLQDYVTTELASLHSMMSRIDKDLETAIKITDDEAESIINIHNKIDEAINRRTILKSIDQI